MGRTSSKMKNLVEEKAHIKWWNKTIVQYWNFQCYFLNKCIHFFGFNTQLHYLIKLFLERLVDETINKTANDPDNCTKGMVISNEFTVLFEFHLSKLFYALIDFSMSIKKISMKQFKN